MNSRQLKTVAELDYKKRVNSQFVSNLLAYTLRTNRAIGIHQLGNFERGLLDYQKRIINEANIAEWQALIATCEQAIETIKAQYLAGNISGDLAKRKGELLGKLIESARQNLGIDNGE